MEQNKLMTIVSHAIEALEAEFDRLPTTAQVLAYLQAAGYDLSLEDVKRAGDDVRSVRKQEEESEA